MPEQQTLRDSYWRLVGRYQNPEGGDHCPGGCYKFHNDNINVGNFHVPIDMFWGKIPWNWFGPGVPHTHGTEESRQESQRQEVNR